MQAAIYGFAGERLTPGERDFLKDADPAGYILFRRNCVDKEQVISLFTGGRTGMQHPPKRPRSRESAEL